MQLLDIHLSENRPGEPKKKPGFVSQVLVPNQPTTFRLPAGRIAGAVHGLEAACCASESVAGCRKGHRNARHCAFLESDDAAAGRDFLIVAAGPPSLGLHNPVLQAHQVRLALHTLVLHNWVGVDSAAAVVVVLRCHTNSGAAELRGRMVVVEYPMMRRTKVHLKVWHKMSVTGCTIEMVVDSEST